MSAFSSLDNQAQENEPSTEGIDSKQNDLNHKPAPIGVSLSLAAAVRAHKKGKMEKAVQIYSDILRKYPDHADANYLLGVAAYERGLKADALAMIERAIDIDPTNAAYLGKLGEILTIMGRVERAEQAYQKAAELAPHDVRFHLGRAQILEKSGEFENALTQYHRIIENWTDSYEALYRCAAIEARLGQREDARRHAKAAFECKEDYAEAHHLYALLVLAQNETVSARKHFALASKHSEARSDLHMKVANKLYQLNDFDAALAALRRETALNATNPAAYVLMGDCLVKKGEHQGGVLSYERAIANDQGCARAYARRGLSLLALGQVQDAHASCQKAIQVDRHDWENLCAMGIVLRETDHLIEGIDFLNKAVLAAPSEIRPAVELALAYQDNLDLENALHHIRQAQSLAPKDKEIEFRKGQILLQSGRWTEGWRAYEARTKLSTYKTVLSEGQCDAPLWDGEIAEGQRIILYCENNVSDAIQFIRFAPLVKERVGEVYVACPKDMARLFAAASGVDGVVPQGTALPRHDFSAALNSLPYLLGIEAEGDLPFFAPYLSAAERDVALWRERLDRDARCTSVGLVWQGDPAYRKDTRRSPGIWPFSRLFYMRNIDFFSLQVGDGADVLSDPQLAKVVRNYGIDLLDFADTAALIEALDLVITCDTAVAHLAGAMGKPVWMVLPYALDWRWGLPQGGEGSPCLWYPSMTLYRQSVHGDWADIFARLGQELDRFNPKK